MARSEQEIRSLLNELSKLGDAINKLKTDIAAIDDIRMSDTVNNQIRQQITLLQQLQSEYGNLRQAVQGTGRLSLPGRAGAPGTIYGGPGTTQLSGRTVYDAYPNYPQLPARATQMPISPSTSVLDFRANANVFEKEYSRLIERSMQSLGQPGQLSGVNRIFNEELEAAILRAEQEALGEPGQARRIGFNELNRTPTPTRTYQGRITNVGFGNIGQRPGYSPYGLGDFVPEGTPAFQGLGRFSPQEFEALNSEFSKGIKLAGQYGYTIDNLQNVYKESTTGISTLRFQIEKMPGIFEKLNVTMDKHGNILQDSQKRYRGFASTVARNIAEVAKWTIAVQVIYAPMRKFQELIDTMIANESKLADITVAVGKAQADTNRIFSDAADVADVTGESINGVLEGYELAYRAAGTISDPIERATTANILLADSMVLSKLSGLDQAIALDTLVGALNQLGYGLTEGRVLIDKWVKVANNANVSLATLAESFAITATSAENAGLSVDELNGIIATVAENTTLSATEAGNAVRAFISGFQTEKAQKELSAYGIALKNASGEMTSFYDVMIEIYKLQEQGLISDAELNKIGEAIGGGARRGAQVVTTIENLGRVQEVARVSASAHGDAEEALGIKLDTVQTKVTELGNSFQSLAQTLGTEGGLLDVFKVFADFANLSLKAIDGLAGALGNALPVMLAFGLAMKQISERGGFAERFENAQLSIAQRFPAGRAQNFLASQRGTYALLGGLSVAGMAGTSLAQGETDTAVGNVVGGIVGGIVGGLSGPQGIAIGSTIGSAIGGSFVDNVLSYEGTFDELFQNVFRTATEEIPEADKSLQDLLNEDRQAFIDEVTGGTTGQALGAFLTQAIYNGFAGLTNIFRPSDQDISGISRGQAGLAFSGLASRFGGGQNTLVQQALELRAPITEEGNVREGTAFAERRNALAEEYSGILSDITKNLREEAQQQLATGEITGKQFNTILESLGGLDIKIAGFYTAFGKGIKETNPGLETQADLFQYLADTIAVSSEDDIEYLSGLQNSLVELEDILERMGGAGEITIGDRTFTKEQVESEIASVRELAVEYTNLLQTQQRFASFRMPSIVNVDATQSDFQKILEYADQWMKDLYDDLVSNDLIDLTLEEWRSTFEGFFVDLGEENGRQYIEGFSQQAITGAQKTLEDMGEIFSSQDNIGLKAFQDLSVSELQNLAAQSLAINEQLKAQYGQFGYKGDTETFIGVAKDGIAGPITAELTILQMLMRDLIDVNEEQLEGIYNLPADASFYVPFTGYALGQGGGGGGGLGDIYELLKNLLVTDQTGGGAGGGAYIPNDEQIKKIQESLGQQVTSAQNDYAEELFKQRGAMEAQIQQQEPDATTRALAGDTTITTEKETPAWIQPLVDAFSSIGESLRRLPEIILGEDLKAIEGKGFGKADKTAVNIQELSAEVAKTPINTNFNLNIQSDTQLYLDGQIVANVVKSYLQEELVKQESTSTITKGVTI